MIKVITGTPALLQLQLFDGATDRYPQAYVRNGFGSLVFTVPLTHVGLGLYEGFFTPPAPGYYTSTFIVYEDAGHTTEDLYYEHATDIYGAEAAPITPSTIAAAVWDEPMLAHSISGTFGIHFQVIRQFSENAVYELIDTNHGLQAIMNNVTNQGVLDRIEINQNESKIDLIIPAVNLARDAVLSSISGNLTAINNLSNQLMLVDTHLTNEIIANRNKIDQAIAAINSLSNNTTVRFIVPEQLMKPLSGTTPYQFHLRLFDSLGNPEAPDTAPTIRIRDINSGTDIVFDAPMTQDGVKVGAYYYTFTISAGSLLHHYLVEATVVEQGVTKYIPAVTEITEYQSDLEAIQLQLNAVDTKVSVSKNMLENPIYGLQALENDLSTIDTHVLDVDNKVDVISSKCDNLPNILATKADISDVKNTVLTRPTLVQIQSSLEFVRQQIMGLSNRNITEVYNKIDFTGLMQSNDPRLQYLDAYISSRSTLTAAQVWTYVNRTLTSISIPTAEFKKVWEFLTTELTLPNSIGKYIVDRLDAPISTRATQAQVQTLLGGVAQEVSIQQAIAKIDQDIINGTICCSNLTNLLTAVKVRTDKIPANPATEQNIDTAEVNLSNLMGALGLIVTAIKASTDKIPADPAKEGTVAGIPHNPVLATDPRLGFLDASISSRATPVNVSNLATKTDLNNSTAAIITQVDANEAKLNTLQTSVNQKPNTPYFDSKFAVLATYAQLIQIRNEIIAELPDYDLTAAEIWSYVTRTLTTPFPDISNLATKNDVKYNQYSSKFSTTYRNTTNDQELIVWGEKDGQRVSGSSNCTVNIKSTDGASLWSATISSPNADGVYRFIHTISAAVDQNYYIVITMTIDSAVRTTQQAFFTVG